jgi:putative ABC transport system permease protein
MRNSVFRAGDVGPAAVLTLALGIAGCVTVYSFLYDVFLKPLPYAEPDRLVQAWERNVERDWYKVDAAPANFLDWRDRSSTFVDMAAYSQWPVSRVMTGTIDPYVLDVGYVTGNVFDVLGVQPALGRAIRWEETWSDSAPVAVLGDVVWRTQFDADPGVIGRHVELNGEAHEIVAVMPPGFFVGPRGNEAWLPYRWEPDEVGQDSFRRAHFISVFGRLAPGATVEQAEAELHAIATQLQIEHPQLNRMMDTGVTPIGEWMSGGMVGSAMLMLTAVLLVLLVACVNVSGLLLARGISRQHQFAVRAALGAGARRLLWLNIVEALQVSGTGTCLGVLLGYLSLRGLLLLWPEASLHGVDADLDPGIVAVAAGLALTCGIATGLLPALRASRVAPGSLLGSARSGLAHARHMAVRRVMVGLQLAVTVVVVAVSITAVQGFLQLISQPPGLAAQNRLVFKLVLPEARYDSDDKIVLAQQQLKQRLEGLPGITSVALASDLPFDSPGWTSDFAVAGRDREDFGVELRHREVSPELFPALEIPLLKGRHFSDRAPGGMPEVIINEAMAERYFADHSPLGERIAFDRYPDGESRWHTIVGVVQDFRQTGFADDVTPEAYESLWQNVDGNAHVIVKSSVDAATVFNGIRETLRSFDDSLALESIRPLTSILSDSVGQPRLVTIVLAAFATLACILAAVGLHGAIMFELNRHRQAIGVRQALGARGSHLARWIGGEWSAILASALFVGLSIGLLLRRPVESWLDDIAATYGLALIVSAATVVMLVAGSVWRGGRSAMQVPPVEALKTE